jgi:hypothetical protein
MGVRELFDCVDRFCRGGAAILVPRIEEHDVVAVMEPIPGGLVMTHGVDRSRIESAFRPVRKASDKTS